MSTNLPAGPDSREEPKPKPDTKQNRRRKKQQRIPGAEELMSQLLSINGAVIMGAMSAKTAGLMHRNIKTVLDAQLKRESQTDTAPNQEALIDICRRDPSTLNALEGLLSDEQLDAILTELNGEEA